MSTIRERMQAVLKEDESALEPDLSVKKVVPQLVLAMQALGMDPGEEEHIDQFLKVLKALATTKQAALKMGLKQWSAAKAGRALRVAKRAV